MNAFSTGTSTQTIRMAPELLLRFDGKCQPKNPGGVACYAWAIHYPEEPAPLAEAAGLVADGGPTATNNYAEWSGLLFGLKYLQDIQWQGKLFIEGDSKLVVSQVTGEWKCKDERMRSLRDQCLQILSEMNLQKAGLASNDKTAENTWEAQWIPREQNEHVDGLMRRVYESHMERKLQGGNHGPDRSAEV